MTPKAKRTVLGCAVCMVIGGGVTIWLQSLDPNEIRIAKKVLDKNLDAPSTAHYLSARQIADEGTMHMVQLVVDAQNQFGAMLRKSLCVTFKIDGDNWSAKRAYGVSECTDPPSAAEITTLKRLNGWPGFESHVDDGFPAFEVK